MTPIPFTKMAVSLSGGGYRATTFHLGALSLLDSIVLDEDTFPEENRLFDKRTLLENVKILSTISGGTLTGIMYALKLAKGEGFKDCYYKLYDLLEEDKLVDHALDKLNAPTTWRNEHKTRDLINAFAEVYDEHFYDRATFEKLYEDKDSHLTDVVFGSSEFTTGLQFRFLESGRARFGNGNLSLPKEAAKDIRLADAAASSSCFPGGFEPMIMPTDFSNGPDSPLSRKWHEKNEEGKYPPTAIMDGGIIDNQGIEGVKQAEDRHSDDKGPFIGTYIISDVSGKTMAPYKVPVFTYSRFNNFFSLSRINWMAALLLVTVVGLLFFRTPEALWAVIAASGILTLIALWFALFLAIWSFLRKQAAVTFAGDEIPEILKDLKVLLKTPVYILVYLIKFRATSALKMVTDIFLRRIRRLQIDALFENPNWKYRLVPNDIHSLQNAKGLTPALRKVIAAANKMPTTLWFTDKEKQDGALDDLIACGQFTLCSNLANYIRELDSESNGNKEKVWDQIQPHHGQIKALLKVLEAYWERFTLDPHWLVKQYKKERELLHKT